MDIAHVLTYYFKGIFTTFGPSGIDTVLSLVAGRVTDRHRALLTEPFTCKDVEEALFQMHPTKAPGLDGFPALFYQKFWKIIGEDVTNFCLQIQQGNILPGMINQTLQR